MLFSLTAARYRHLSTLLPNSQLHFRLASFIKRKMSSEVDKRPIVGIVQNVHPNLAEALKKLRPDLRIEFNLCELKRDEETLQQLQRCEVLLLFPFLFEQLDVIYRLPNLKWMHTMSAGVDRIIRNLDKSKPFPEYTLTRNGGFFGRQMAEFVMGQIVAHERNFKAIWDNQKTKTWKIYTYRSLSKVSLGIIGLGDIGKEIAQLAKAFDVTVWAVVRTMPSNDQKCQHVDQYRLYSDLAEMLSACDYICVVLPSTPSTDGLLDGDVLEPCKNKKSVLINIGRGNCIKNDTVLDALRKGWLSHAILDVMEEEPLPQSSSLWDHPNVTITPHLSGLCVDEELFLKEFLKNYDKYVKGEPLNFVVDWQKGY